MMTFVPSLHGAYIALLTFGLPLVLLVVFGGAEFARRVESRRARAVGLLTVLMVGTGGGLLLYQWLFWRVPYEVKAARGARIHLKMFVPERPLTLAPTEIASMREIPGPKLMGKHLEITTTAGARYLTPTYADHEPNAKEAQKIIAQWTAFASASP